MNHFHGRIEGTNVVVDNCSYKGGDGLYFLISHPHTDHTGGLTETFDKGAIHCSTLCKELLLMRFPLIQQHNPIIGHAIGTTFVLSELSSPQRRGLKSITNNNDMDSEDEWREAQSNGVEVTLIDANHCPGSVMFLIRSTNGKIYLHTGDYRTSDEMIHDSLLTNVWIDIVYMDVTFCHPSLIFPTKKQIAKAFARYINHKKKETPPDKMSFAIMYIDAKQLGVEPFLIELCELFGTQMWANSRSWQYKNLTHFPDTAKYMTLDQTEAMFYIAPNGTSFAEFVKRDRKNRKENHLPSIVYISPTTMYFALRNICATPIKYTESDGITHVLYSMHSDYNEMRRLISKLNVKQVMPFNDPFIPGKGRENTKFPSVGWVRSQFKDCVEQDTTESRDIFAPKLNGVHSCTPTGLDKGAQNDKMMRILRNLQANNKQRDTQCVDGHNSCKSPPKRFNTAPTSSTRGGMQGAKNQNGWVRRMKKKHNATECVIKSTHRKRKRSELKTNDMNHRAAKKPKLVHASPDLDQTPYTPVQAATPCHDMEISPLLSCEPKVQRRHTSDHMDVDNEDHDAKLCIIDENDTTPGDIGNDDSTVNEDTQSQRMQRHCAYKTFDTEGKRRRPCYLSQDRLKNRNIWIYREEMWNVDELGDVLSVVHRLQMKRVYDVHNAKFIVVGSEMMGKKDIVDEILEALGLEYSNGCHHIREVYCGGILQLLCNMNSNPMRGSAGKMFNGKFEDYFILSTFDADVRYLKRKHLWPLKPNKCKNKQHT